MSLTSGLTRRDLFMKLGILVNGVVGVILAVPIVRYLLSPVARELKEGSGSWIPLGNIDRFPFIGRGHGRYRLLGAKRRRKDVPSIRN